MPQILPKLNNSTTIMKNQSKPGAQPCCIGRLQENAGGRGVLNKCTAPAMRALAVAWKLPRNPRLRGPTMDLHVPTFQIAVFGPFVGSN